jgi:dTDP-4-amino-4,6-dideoxygalactose transaminase
MTMEKPMDRIRFNEPYSHAEMIEASLRHIAAFPFDGTVHKSRLEACFRDFGGYFDTSSLHFLQSATSALEVMALAMDLRPGDEIILPSFTYAATANAFARQGAKLVFVDIEKDTLNIDTACVERAVTERTRGIIPIHYGGIAADMGELRRIADSCGALLLEDASHGIGAAYDGKPLGTIGDFGCLSFHHSKNMTAGGSGGCLFVGQEDYRGIVDEIVNQGTNRTAFLSGRVDAYRWQRVGGEYQMTNHAMAFLAEAMKELSSVTTMRQALWTRYRDAFRPLEEKGCLRMAKLPSYARTNGHIFYLLLPSGAAREALKRFLCDRDIEAFSHYEPLHDTVIGRQVGEGRGEMEVTMAVAEGILRLPMHGRLTKQDQDRVIKAVHDYFSR